MRKQNQNIAAMGSFTDFNVWSRALSDDEMKNFTQCVSMMKGNLISWNISDWMVTDDITEDEYSRESVDFDSMCSPRDKITIFPEHIPLEDSMDLCTAFGGTLSITRTQQDYNDVRFVNIVLPSFIINFTFFEGKM